MKNQNSHFKNKVFFNIFHLIKSLLSKTKMDESSHLIYQTVAELNKLIVVNKNSFKSRFETETLKKVILKIWLIFFMKQMERNIRIQKSNSFDFKFSVGLHVIEESALRTLKYF
jgi:hypothetical protein